MLVPSLFKEEVDAIRNGEHSSPISVLGFNKTTVNGISQLVLRIYRPDAREIVILDKTNQDIKYTMGTVFYDDFFEYVFPADYEPFPYLIQMTNHYGETSTFEDPYAFPHVVTGLDQHLFSEGNHHKIYEKLGSHPITINGVEGYFFAVWAPNAVRVSVINDHNYWDGRYHQMNLLGGSGIWEIFIPGVQEKMAYKYEIKSRAGHLLEKIDPYGNYFEVPPKSATLTYNIDTYNWSDNQWMEQRRERNFVEEPISVYEVHLGSWKRIPESNDFLDYKDLAHQLVDYVKDMGYTHIELLPVAEHPFDGSWGYQVTGFYAPTSRFGTPDEFMYFIDHCHNNGIGVLIDWVPGHFPKDGHALAHFDGTCLYEHDDPRQGEHRDWGTLIFNYGRNEVRNFLISNALFWLDKFHIDGLRVDAVASILYLDYSREDGEWIPNCYGGRENLEAIYFLKTFNELVHSYYPGALTIAEESTAWPGVSHPTYAGGLGFSIKWNMGWMNDFLTYISKDPIHRKYHHEMLTFALLYAFTENFMLVLSHDEVVHGKSSILNKMPGDFHEKFDNARVLMGFLYAHPGKKLLFQGAEFGQWDEWNNSKSLDWHLLEFEEHQKLQRFVKEMNHLYRSEKSLHHIDFDWHGFEWVDFHDWENSIVSFIRKSDDPQDYTLFVFNFTPMPRENYRIGVPDQTYFKELINSDSEIYGGKNMGNAGGIMAEPIECHGKQASINANIPGLSMVIFKPEFNG